MIGYKFIRISCLLVLFVGMGSSVHAASFDFELPSQVRVHDEKLDLLEAGDFTLKNEFGRDPPRRVLGNLTSLFSNDANLISSTMDRRWASMRFSPQIFTNEFHRGVSTRDFFRTEIPRDAYSIDRVGFIQGPLPILFGTGTPVGFTHTVGKRALLNRSLKSISSRIVDDGSHRLVLDYNHVLRRREMAFRIIGLHEDGSHFRTPSKIRRESIYANFSWQINDQHQLRFSAEWGQLFNIQAAGSILYDRYTPWLEAGSPMVDQPGVGLGGREGLEWMAGGSYLVFIENSEIPVMDWRRMARGSPPEINGLPERRFSFDPDNLPGGLSSYHSLIGNSNQLKRDYQVYSGFWESLWNEWLSVELAAHYESGSRDNFQGMRPVDHALQVDANLYLPDGSPNPNAGKPYLETTSLSLQQNYDWESAQGRLLTTMDLALEDYYPALGRYELGGLLSFWNLERSNEWNYEANLTPLEGFPENINHPANRIRRRVYLEPSLEGSPVFASSFAGIEQDGVKSAFVASGNSPQYEQSQLRSWLSYAKGFYFQDRLSVFYAFGNDRVELKEGIFERDERGLWPSSKDYSEKELHRFNKIRRSSGVAFEWNENWTLYYNLADSFLPPGTSQRDVFGERIAPQEVRGYESGVAFILGDRRFASNLSFYEITRTNQPSGALRGSKSSWIYSIWDELNPELSMDRIAWVDLQDTRSRGFEFDLVANPSRNLRVAWNVGYDRRSVSEIMPSLSRYLDTYLPLWQDNASQPVNHPDGESVGDLVELIIDDYEQERAQIGARLLRNREWQSQLSVNYRFDRQSVLNGWSLGFMTRWMERPIIGFASLPQGRLDGHQPYYGNSLWHLNSWLGYVHRWDNGNVWVMRLQVNNLLDNGNFNANRAIDDGTGVPIIAEYSSRAPRMIMLSNTLRF